MGLAENNEINSATSEQVVIFTLHNELYGINIAQVNEISELRPMNLVPKSPEFIKGVINYHGKIVAIHDLARFLIFLQKLMIPSEEL